MTQTIESRIETQASAPERQLERRFGWRAELLGIAMLVLLVGGVAGHFYLASATTPQAAALAYVEARASDNNDAVWGAISVGKPTVIADASLTDRTALAAWLADSANRVPAVGAQAKTTSQTPTSAVVAATYQVGGVTKTEPLNLELDRSQRRYFFYPYWRVVVVPTVVSLALPNGAGQATIDGRPVPASIKSLALFPGDHQLRIAASPLFQADSESFSATDTQKMTAVVPHLTLTDQAVTAAKATLKDTITKCAAAATLSPDACPQHVNDVAKGPVQWTLVGDPTAAVAFNLDSNGKVLGFGWSQWIVDYKHTNDAAIHKAAVTSFQAQFTWNGSSLAVAGFGAPPALPANARPAGATDQAVLAKLQPILAACVNATSLSPDGCPQSVPDFYYSKVVWHQAADPLAGASVSWDGTTQLLKVTGAYSMSVDYEVTYPYESPAPKHKTASGQYTADFLWDGQNPVFVNFE